jgi:hypothetical protein
MEEKVWRQENRIENGSLHSLRMLIVYPPTFGILTFMLVLSAMALAYACKQMFISEVCGLGEEVIR